jgi:hypothetical protein
MTGANINADDPAILTLFRQWRELLDHVNASGAEYEEDDDARCEQLWAIERQIFDTPMSSAAGMAVKACIFIHNEKGIDGECCYSPTGYLHLEWHALKGLAEDAARLVPETKPLVAWILDVPTTRPKKTERKRRRGRPTLKLVVNDGGTAA